MFQTSHPWAFYHAAGRCLSGGQISITDRPGEHDLEIIKQITAQSIYGQTVILRPDVVGRTIDAYTSYDEEAMLKISTFAGRHKTGVGILGLFNRTAKALAGLIALEEFPGSIVGEEYVVRVHPTGLVSPVRKAERPSPLLSVTLPAKGCLILSAFHVQRVIVKRQTESASRETLRFANMGLLGKITGAAAIVGTKMTTHRPDRIGLTATVKALGTLGQYLLFHLSS